jgi:hypothetical protein
MPNIGMASPGEPIPEGRNLGSARQIHVPDGEFVCRSSPPTTLHPEHRPRQRGDQPLTAIAPHIRIECESFLENRRRHSCAWQIPGGDDARDAVERDRGYSCRPRFRDVPVRRSNSSASR